MRSAVFSAAANFPPGGAKSCGCSDCVHELVMTKGRGDTVVEQ